MAKSRANPGFGVIFAFGNGASPEVFTPIGEIVDLPGIGTTHRTDEVTHMSSPGGWAEFIGLGVKEAKEFTIAMNFVADDPHQIALYQTYVESGAKRNYQIQFTDDDETQLTFEALISDTDISHPRDAKADLSVQVRPSGAYAWGSGT